MPEVKDEDLFLNGNTVYEDMKFCIPNPTMESIVGKSVMNHFNELVKKYSELKGSVDGLNSEVDYGIIGTITNHVIYEKKPFRTFRASKASVIIAKAAIKIMKIAKSKGFNLKIGYSSYMPFHDESKFVWVLENTSEFVNLKLTDKGQELLKNFTRLGSRYPGLYLDSATIVQP